MKKFLGLILFCAVLGALVAVYHFASGPDRALQAELNEAKAKLTLKEIELVKKTSELDAATTRLNQITTVEAGGNLRNQVLALTDTAAMLRNDQRATVAALDSTKNALQAAQERNTALLREVERFRHEIEQQGAALDEIKGDKARLDQEVANLREGCANRIQALADDKRALQEQVNRLTQENAALNAFVDSMRTDFTIVGVGVPAGFQVDEVRLRLRGETAWTHHAMLNFNGQPLVQVDVSPMREGGKKMLSGVYELAYVWHGAILQQDGHDAIQQVNAFNINMTTYVTPPGAATQQRVETLGHCHFAFTAPGGNVARP